MRDVPEDPLAKRYLQCLRSDRAIHCQTWRSTYYRYLHSDLFGAYPVVSDDGGYGVLPPEPTGEGYEQGTQRHQLAGLVNSLPGCHPTSATTDETGMRDVRGPDLRVFHHDLRTHAA